MFFKQAGRFSHGNMLYFPALIPFFKQGLCAFIKFSSVQDAQDLQTAGK